MMFHVLTLLTIVLWTDSIKAAEYNVSVYTGTVFGAGTDAKVYITLYGDKGSSSEVQLQGQGGKNFENGQIDTFNINTTSDLGHIEKINIRHDNSWLGSAWFLEKIELSSPSGDTTSFPCHKWLATNEDDGKISRDLFPVSPQSKESSNHTCRSAVGIQSGAIQDSQIKASSSYDDKHLPFHARLNLTVAGSRGGWCSATSDGLEFLEVDLRNTTFVTGVATQGQSMFDNWVTSYTLAFSLNHTDWMPYMENHVIKNFTGNTDRNSVVTHWFPGVKARYVRLQPVSWNGITNCLRMEIYDCRNDTGKLSNHAHPEKPEPKNTSKDNDEDITLPASLKKKAVTFLRFEEIYQQNVIIDESDQHNDAKIVNFARISKFSVECGFGVDLNGGDIIFDGDNFRGKPRDAVTIAMWVRLFSTDGANSLFDTIGGSHSKHSNGQYHLETDGSSVRWFHRNEKGDIVFNVTTEDVIFSHTWTHVAGTYDSKIGQADVFVNAKFIMRGEGSGKLSQDWEERAGIGEHKGHRLLDGLVDDFYMADSALKQDEIKMLMNKCQFEKECFSPIGMESMKVKDNEITASSYWNPHKPFYARLNLVKFYDDPQKTAWCADSDDQAPYLTVDLKEEKTITGVAIQGPSILDNFVTSFKLCHSHSGRNFECLKANETEQVLTGAEDKDTVKMQWINRLFDARYVRIYPMSWYGDHICLRAEIFGCMTGLLSEDVNVRNHRKPKISIAEQKTAEFNDCSVSCGKGVRKQRINCDQKKRTRGKNCPPGVDSYVKKVECVYPSCPDCFSPMGMSNGSVLDSEISSSSTMDAHHSAAYARVTIATVDGITGRGCWCAKTADKNQYIEIDLRKPRKVTGIATQGEITDDRWITRYRLTYSTNRLSWAKYTENSLPKTFEANDDADTVSIRHLQHPITARYVRIHPSAWHGNTICMRAEVYGCDHQGLSTKPVKVKLTKDDSQMQRASTDMVTVKVSFPPKSTLLKNLSTAHLGNPFGVHHVIGAQPINNRVRINEDNKQKPKSVTMFPDGRHYYTHQTIERSQPALARTNFQHHRLSTYPYVDNMNVPLNRYGVKIQLNRDTLTKFSPVVGFPQSNTPASNLNNVVRQPGVYERLRAINFPPAQSNVKTIAIPQPQHVYQVTGVQSPLRPPFIQQTNYPNNIAGYSSLTRGTNALIYPRKSQPGSYRSAPGPMRNRPGFPVASKPIFFTNRFVPPNSNRPIWMSRNPFSKNNIPSSRLISSIPMRMAPSTMTKKLFSWPKKIPSTRQQAESVNNYLPKTFQRKFYSKFIDSFNHPLYGNKFLNEQNYQAAGDNNFRNSQNIYTNKKFDNRIADAEQITSNADKRMWQLITKKLTEVAGLKKAYIADIQRSPYEWSAFTPCSVTCGEGMKKRHRMCKTDECHTSGTETEILPCLRKKCAASIGWSAYSPCSVTCGSGVRIRSRVCNGKVCPAGGRQTESIKCKTPGCPVFHLTFEGSEGSIILDQSKMNNNAFLEEDGKLVPHKGACGKVVELGRHGDIRLNENTFRGKPYNGISISVWVNLHNSSRGSHSLFSTAHVPRGYSNIQGGYHFEVDDGSVRWFHRKPIQNPVFSVVTDDVIKPDEWHHIVVTYDVAEGAAKVYVDGEMKASGAGLGPLDRNWGYKATIGSFDYDGRFLNGMLDEFYMFNYAISQEQVQSLLNFKCTI